MINEEVRHIIEPELAEGEELLWAEKTTVSAKEAIVNPYREDTDTFVALLKYFLWVGVPVLLVLIILFPSFRVVGIILLILVPVCFMSNASSSEDHGTRFENIDIGGYALTNLRLFELDKKIQVTSRDDASKLRKVVEESTCVTLKPIGGGVLKTRTLFFLNNNYATTNYIRSQIENSLSKD